MQLCRNRAEGFGPSSSIASPLPTSCFVDVVLVPLPTWLALALLPALYLATRSYNKSHFDPSTLHLRNTTSTRRICFNATSTIYYILIIANILMLTLEIVRLALLETGIGLLPFAYVGLLLGGLLHWTRGFSVRIRGWQGINAVVWTGGIVMSIIQAVGLAREGIDKGKSGKYPISDQVIDVAVMAGVYAVIGILEIVIDMWRSRRERAVKQGGEVADRNEFADLGSGKGISR